MSEISIAPPAGAAQADAALPQSPPPLSVCVSCGSPEARAFCPACGQRTRRERFTLRAVAREAASDVLNLDRGLLHTAVELSRRPGEAIAEYVSGRTARFAGPAKYFFLLAALATLVYLNTGMAQASVEMYGAGGTAAPGSPEARIMEFFGKWLNLIMAASLPFSALATRLFFRKSGHNFAEHLIFNTYVYAQACLLFIAIAVPFHFAGAGPGAGMVVYAVLSCAYTAWAAVRFFRVSVVSGTLRAIGATLLAYVAYFAAVTVVGIGVGVAYLLATRG